MGRGGRRERRKLSILRRNASVIGQTACWRRTEVVGLSGKQGGTAEIVFLSLFPTGEQGLFLFHTISGKGSAQCTHLTDDGTGGRGPHSDGTLSFFPLLI